MKEYPRFQTDEFMPYDPLWLAKETELLICRGSARKYTDFYCTGVYGGISTGYAVGCCLRCIFCWVDWSRDFPEEHGNFYTSRQVASQLVKKAKAYGINKLRISGGEPTLGKEHLLSVLDLVSSLDYLFILETNGILLGSDQGYVKALKRYSHIHVRLSLKAGTKEGFRRRTGAKGEFYELPFTAIENLSKEGVSFHVACMSDPRLMPKEEREEVLRRLKEASYDDYFEEEICDPYQHTMARLKAARLEIF